MGQASRPVEASFRGLPDGAAGADVPSVYLEDASGLKGGHAERVFVPADDAAVAAVLRDAAAAGISVTVSGAGTGVAGGRVPFGGWVLSLEKFTRLEVHPGYAVAGAGVLLRDLHAAAAASGQLYPPDPTETGASIGGNIACNASGSRSFRYGATGAWVERLRVVLAGGRILDLARGQAIDFDPGTIPLPAVTKNTAGYLLRPGMDWVDLFIGSEGTLGVITELTLRLHGIPEAIASGVCSFPTVADACNTTILTIQTGIPVARIELLDALQVKACNTYSKLDLPETPTLFVEFHGSAASVKEQSERFGEIAKDCGGGEFAWATRPEERTRLWQARHDVYWSTFTLRPGAKSISTDVCVPISRLAECVTETAEDIARTGLVAPIVGHVGDGNFHLSIMVDMEDADEVERADKFVGRLNLRAIEMDGTCTGEHGVGQGKMKYLAAEHGAGLEVMRAIKRTIDPRNIMNPGKIVALI